MWESAFEPEADAIDRIKGIRQDDEVANLKRFRCTAEHVERQADGGSDAAANIVAACAWCNERRGEMSVDDMRALQLAALSFNVAGRDNDTDDVFYRVMPIKREYLYKWAHNLFVSTERWKVVVAQMEIGDYGRGKEVQSVSSDCVVYPYFRGDDSFAKAKLMWQKRKIIDGTLILLESAEHAAILREKFADTLI